jgi:hypothetical protein
MVKCKRAGIKPSNVIAITKLLRNNSALKNTLMVIQVVFVPRQFIAIGDKDEF